jgi:hypothetical protein
VAICGVAPANDSLPGRSLIFLPLAIRIRNLKKNIAARLSLYDDNRLRYCGFRVLLRLAMAQKAVAAKFMLIRL